jgi:putative ABC transport system ATP-binding protein
MITLDAITLTYPDGTGRVTAVDDVSLTASAGTVTAIMGPSGSGKSSVLAVAATLIRPDRGRVLIGEVEASGLSRAEASRLRRESIGIVFQQSNLLPSLTAVEQLLVMRELDGAARRGRARALDRARDLLVAVGLEGQLDRRPAQLSGGQRQRVNIARSLMNEPQVLLVDEPTSALDQERGAEIIDLIVELSAERATATLLVTHDLVHLLRMHATVRMLDGRVSPSSPRRAASSP